MVYSQITQNSCIVHLRISAYSSRFVMFCWSWVPADPYSLGWFYWHWTNRAIASMGSACQRRRYIVTSAPNGSEFIARMMWLQQNEAKEIRMHILHVVFNWYTIFLCDSPYKFSVIWVFGVPCAAAHLNQMFEEAIDLPMIRGAVPWGFYNMQCPSIINRASKCIRWKV